MPTIRGWAVAGGAVGLMIAGRIFGATGLQSAGFALVVLVAAAIVVVRSRAQDLDVERRISPERANAGQPVTVSLRLRNRGRGSTPLVLLQDRLPLELQAQSRFALPGLEAGGDRETSYTVRPGRRGRYEVGPLEMAFEDPFGLGRVRMQAAAKHRFLVHPRIERLALPRDLGQQRSLAVSSLKQPTGATGDDFYTLREYVEGDDLRKIHWASTAKRRRYMIRQEEIAWHTKATIMLDDRRPAAPDIGNLPAFERAVDTTASLVDLYHRSGYTYRLACAVEGGFNSARGQAHFHRCLDLLAVVQQQQGRASADPLLVRLAEIDSGGGGEGTLALVSAELSPDVATALSRARRVFRQIIAISVPAHRFGEGGTRQRWAGEQRTHEVVRLLAHSGIKTIVLGPGDPISSAWGSLSRPERAQGQAWGQKPELV